MQQQLRPAVTDLPREYQQTGSSPGHFARSLASYHLCYQFTLICLKGWLVWAKWRPTNILLINSDLKIHSNFKSLTFFNIVETLLCLFSLFSQKPFLIDWEKVLLLPLLALKFCVLCWIFCPARVWTICVAKWNKKLWALDCTCHHSLVQFYTKSLLFHWATYRLATLQKVWKIPSCQTLIFAVNW